MSLVAVGARIPVLCFQVEHLRFTVSSIKLETELRPNSAGVPYIFLLRIEAMRFPTFRLLL